MAADIGKIRSVVEELELLNENPYSETIPLNGSCIYFDLTRLTWRALSGHLTGIDRVELAYATHLISQTDVQVEFVIFSPFKKIVRVDKKLASSLIQKTTSKWKLGSDYWLATVASAIFLMSALFPKAVKQKDAVYLNVSGFPLWQKNFLRHIKNKLGLKVFVLCHDTIPIEFPEFVPDQWTPMATKAYNNIKEYADGIIANSQYTKSKIQEFNLKPTTRVRAIPLGVSINHLNQNTTQFFPFKYFVCLGTIEPRKNHNTLISAWRIIIEETKPKDVPHLVVIGRIGWDSEELVSTILKSKKLSKYIHLIGWQPETRVHQMIKGAKAVLCPSMVEEFSLPVREAIALKTPVICSDIDAHRELGSNIIEYVDPLHPKDWAKIISVYCDRQSERRMRQETLLKKNQVLGWDEHVQEALHFIQKVHSLCDRTTQRDQQ